MNPTRYALPALVLSAVSCAAAASQFSAVPSGSYQLDPTHAYITFSYDHFGLSNPVLSFDEFMVDLNLDVDDPTRSMVLVNIDANSVVAGSEIYQQALTGEDWLHTSDYPEITFQSGTIEPNGEGAWKVSGELTIKDVTKPVTLDVSLNDAMIHPVTGKPTIGLAAAATVLRSDFGLDEFVPAVGDEVDISITAELNKIQ